MDDFSSIPFDSAVVTTENDLLVHHTTAYSVSNDAWKSLSPTHFNPLNADLLQVGVALAQFEYFTGHEWLDLALAMCENFLKSPSILDDPVHLPEWSFFHAKALRLRFERDGEEDDIDRAKEISQRLVASTTLRGSTLVHALYGLGRVHETLRDEYASTDHTLKAHECYRKAMSAAQGQDIPNHLSDELSVHLSRVLLLLTDFGNTKGNSSEASVLLLQVIERTSKSHPIAPYAIALLSSLHERRLHLGSQDPNKDLIRSGELIREALSLAPNHRYRPLYLRFFAVLCKDQGTSDSVRESIFVAEQALALLQDSALRQARPAIVGVLSTAYFKLFTLEGCLEYLNSAVDQCRMATKSKYVHISTFGDLCNRLSARFQSTGQLVDIDQAIAAGQQALEMRPTGHLLTFSYAYLSHAYVLRYAATGEHVDFEGARVHIDLGLNGTEDPTLQSMLLLFTAILYRLRFDTSYQEEDLNKAVENGRDAVVLMRSGGNKDLPEALCHHAEHRMKYFELHLHLQDLRDAICCVEDALSLVPDASDQRHMLLFQYGRGLRLRFVALRHSHDSEKCAEVLQTAIELAAVARQPQQTLYLAELAHLCSARYAISSSPKDLEVSLGYYIEAASLPEGLTRDRFQTCITGAKLAQDYHRPKQATDLLSVAVSLLPRIAWLGLSASKRHAKLIDTATQLACDAAASAIEAGQLERGVELLDEGRSVMWRSILELRADLSGLSHFAPDLARELLEVTELLEHDDMVKFQISEKQREDVAARRRRAAERREQLINDVRALEGFKLFLLPMNFSVLKQAARHGPVTLLNVSKYRSDALIVTSSEPVRTVPLPGLDLGTIRRLAYVLARTLGVARDSLGRDRLEAVLLDICRQLWKGGLEAVAAALRECQYQPRHGLLRVWWIPTGYLSLLPIHCAGPYAIGRAGIPELFISSYTTTLSALLTARETRPTQFGNVQAGPRMLAIGLPETPDLQSLPYAQGEIEIVDRLPSFSGFFRCLYDADATVTAVTDALPHSNWIHAVCHGRYDPKHPLDSAFNLMDGSLTLSRIVQLRLKDADFAFLSACHSARPTAWVPDESMHLAAGLQVAGFRGVVGTTWSMVDRDGPKLAQRFYYWLTWGGRAPDAKNGAEALHLAIKDLRGTGVPLFRWGAFVHFGL